MGTTIGALVVLMPAYGYLLGIGIVLGLIIVPLVLIRNVALAMGMGRISLPFVAWLTGPQMGMFVVWSVVIGLTIAAKFSPAALASMRRTTGLKDFIRGD